MRDLILKKNIPVKMVHTTAFLALVSFGLLQSKTLTENEWGFLNYVFGALVSILIFAFIWGIRALISSIKENTMATKQNSNLLIRHDEKLLTHESKIDSIADDIHDIKKTLSDHEKRLSK